MTKTIKPLLAAKADLDKINYPVLATPKLDGIRCLAVEGTVYSRNMKRIRNIFVQNELKGLHGLDGELMVEGDFNEVQSGIMKETGEPCFTFHVFDYWDSNKGYEDRLRILNTLKKHTRVKLVLPVEIHNEELLLEFLDNCLEKGYEGAMIRSPNGIYKHGRSTVNDGILSKLKKFHDDEGVLINVIEATVNNNIQERDELGRSKRSKNKENLVPAGTAGSLTIGWEGKEFNVGFGPGFGNAEKKAIWDAREFLIGDLVKFSYQELSKDGIPRFGKMICFRDEDDL